MQQTDDFGPAAHLVNSSVLLPTPPPFRPSKYLGWAQKDNLCSSFGDVSATQVGATESKEYP